MAERRGSKRPRNITDHLSRDGASKRIDEAANVPAKLIWALFYRLNLSPERWNRLMDRYFNSHLNANAGDRKKIAHQRNNLGGALLHRVVSWKTLMRALTILAPTSYEVQITCNWKDGSSTTESISVDNPFAQIAGGDAATGFPAISPEIIQRMEENRDVIQRVNAILTSEWSRGITTTEEATAEGHEAVIPEDDPNYDEEEEAPFDDE